MTGNMGKTLMILAHPNIGESVGNKTIKEAFAKESNTEVRHLDTLYPDFKIDIEAEQKALLEADTIVFQHPLFWYNIPAILKQWIDQVIQFGFAFGNNYALENKKVVISFTIGSSKDLYPEETIQNITFPLRGLASYCKMNYIGEIHCNNINGYTDEAKENAITESKKHAQQLLELINN